MNLHIYNINLSSKAPIVSKSFNGFINKQSFIINNKDPFLFCYREGNLLFGLQHELTGEYNAYICSSPAIAEKTALQYATLLESIKDNIFGFHSVTMEQDGRVILLSAPSGTGKTTHSELWRKHFGARVINGDYAFLEAKEDETVFHGTPFSGSSPYHEEGEWRVDDIVFIKQAPYNRATRLSGRAAYINFIENAFIPRWDKEKTTAVLALIERTLKNVRVWQLECTPDREAAEVLYEAIFEKKAVIVNE